MESDQEIVEVPLELVESEVEEEIPVKKTPAKGKMTEKKLDNLAKARAAKKKNLDIKKYSKESRTAAEERIEIELNKHADALAEKKALEIIEKLIYFS